MGEREKEEMKRTNSVKLMLAALVAMLAMASVCWSAEPPPPVDQNLGIPDSVFNLLTEADCRACHNQNPPIAAVDPTYLPDRHHLLLGTDIPTPTAVPNPKDPAGNVYTVYECLTCHTMVWNPTTFTYQFANYRDCLLCHVQTGGLTVHHATADALTGDCQACHGALVDNMADGHYVPTYIPSLVTPWPSHKPTADVNGEGNCNFCHNTMKLTDPNYDPDTATTVVDPASGVTVYRNNETHHGTGLQTTGHCEWCHLDGLPSYTNPMQIRGCENCHGVKSLHSIQLGLTASTLPGVSPGNELPYKGHIGAQWDCWGCHGNNGVTAASETIAPYSGIVPYINYLSASSFEEGTAATITVTGASFIDSIEGTVIESTFQLVDGLGNITTLQTLSLTNDTAEVVVPGFLAAGSYTLTAVKNSSQSNPKVIAVTPVFTIYSAVHTGTTYNITGVGLVADADYEAASLGTSVAVTGVDGTTEECTMVSATGSDLIAKCPIEGSSITVTNLYSEASARSEVKRVAPTRILSTRR